MGSITDSPIRNKSADLLKLNRYASALSKFIINSDTPITIGLQGEWGTGKTSLMSLMREELHDNQIATSWVNTWEYSLFRTSKDSTPAILRGMLEMLKESCKERGTWTLGDETKNRFNKAARFIGSLTNQVLKSQIGLDLKQANQEAGTSGEQAAAEIFEIKEIISMLINDLIRETKNPIKKVVFFVDDLDRIPPNDAIEVLEALKNIFDIPNCIFVLAIDYDVVVKGLESKFGVKTEKNEREFRSFFDKIIQLPFTMPIGAYDIDNFLLSQLTSLNVELGLEKELYPRIIQFTIGPNPRSLKRYLNSFSLINELREIESDEDGAELSNNFMLFALLGIQISYPSIFRLLLQASNFVEWDKTFAYKNDIDLEAAQESISKRGTNELLDEEWEQIIWAHCLKDQYLKSRAFSILELMNLIRSTFSDTLEEEIEKAIRFAAITSVDDDQQAKQASRIVGQKKILFNGLENKTKQLEEYGYSTENLKHFNFLFSSLEKCAKDNKNLRFNYARSGCTFNDDSIKDFGSRQLLYASNPAKRTGTFGIWLKRNLTSSGELDELRNQIIEKLGIKDTVNIQFENRDDKYRALFIKSGIFSEFGKEADEKYHQLLKIIINYVTAEGK